MSEIKDTTGKSLASRWKHRFVYALIACGGRPLAYLFLYVLVFCYCVRGSVRAKSRAYITRRFAPKNRWEFFKHTYLLNLTFARTLADRAAMGILGDVSSPLTPQTRAQCQALAAQGKGILLLSAHAGCWQTAVNVMADLNIPLHVLYYRNPKDNDKLVSEHTGRKAPFTLINPAGPLGGVEEMMAALARGEAVCAMADRVFGNEKNAVEADFLGGKIRVPYSFYRIAAATGAPVVAAFFPREGRGKFSAWVFPPFYVPDLGPAKENYRPYAQQFVDGLARFCIKYPYQFFNYYDLWAPLCNNKR